MSTNINAGNELMEVYDLKMQWENGIYEFTVTNEYAQTATLEVVMR